MAYYQPVGGPGPAIVRYNQANGGTNVHRAADGIAPTWSSGAGWKFLAANTNYLYTGIVPESNQGWSGIAYFKQAVNTGFLFGACAAGAGAPYFGVQPRHNIGARFFNGDGLEAGSLLSAGTMGIAGPYGYVNGLYLCTADPYAGTMEQIAIGRLGTDNGWYFSGDVLAVAIYSRTLSPAEVWKASYQMQYCDINPDWSAWGRRREWYFMKAAATTGNAAWYYSRMRR